MSTGTEYVRYYWKAVIAFIAPGAGSVIGATLAGSDGGTAVTGSEWLVALCIAIVTSAGVAVKSNGPKPADGKHETGSFSRPTDVID